MPSKQKIVELFARLQTTYGHRFASLFPDKDTKLVAMRDWHHQLEGITDDEIDRGFDRLGRRDDDVRQWPPSSFEFRELCKPHREPYERVEFRQRALPQKTAEKSFALDQIAKIRGQVSEEGEA